ncbi:hypothetical protein HG263_08335 [Pseudoalteromonas sp. JBTF-M23]|uniref:Gp5/Type VI secretion system Vgr protein OB-fold domain-containing protein n=1 Tax=Pseudoalteromonas caenipelagi TaxID=2726988 RepID=A0A849VCJ4_9GAMM|nr:phage baseplate assembly protein V [Pseudoalteromonas caenipelagi]NOU50548.1 hypothetical protein [Pseudoalteromonas caenipelagi]
MNLPVNIQIIANGKEINRYGIHALHIDYRAQRIPTATVTLRAGSPATASYPMADDSAFKSGNEVKIKLGRQGQPNTQALVFSGLICAKKLRLSNGVTELKLTLHSDLIKLVDPPKDFIFSQRKTDDAIVREICSERAISNIKVSKSDIEHEQFCRFNMTPWQLVMERVHANGFLMLPSPEKVTIAAIEVVGSKTHSLEVGLDEVVSVELENDVSMQLGSISRVGYDETKQDYLSPATTRTRALFGGALKPQAAAKALSKSPLKSYTGSPQDRASAQAWSKAQATYRTLDLYRGKVVVEGQSHFQLGDKLAVRKMGDEFSGQYIISGVRHKVDMNGWKTQLDLGLQFPTSLTKNTQASSKEQGLLFGKVLKYSKDPKKLYRYKVSIPALTNKSLWCRLASPYAGKEEGLFVPPKPGHEVLLGFVADEPEHPVILGSLHNPKNKPPLPFDGKLERRGLVIVKDKQSLLFDEKEKSTVLAGGKNNSMTINDDKSLQLKRDKTTVVLEKDLQLQSGAQVSLSAKKDVAIKASGKTKIKASKTEIS